MSWLFIILGSFFTICGLTIVFRGINRRLHWPEVPGEVVEFKEHISDTDKGKQISYIPQVKFVVRNKEYRIFADQNMTWRKRDFSKRVTVLYNRDNPEEIYLKDNTLLLGCAIVIFAVLFGAVGISILFK
jgi:hypothetical protein